MANFVWGSNGTGNWNDLANWNDTTTGQNPAPVAPGSNDTVTVNAAVGGGTTVITGTGEAQLLTIGGAAQLDGQFSTVALTLQNNAALAVSGGQLSVGGGITNGYGDNLNLSGGTALIAGGITNNSSGYLVGDSINISGGTATITGDITNNIGGYSTGSSFNVSGGTATIAGSIIDNNSSLNTGVGSFINVSGGTATITGGITSNNSGNEAFDAIDVSGALTVGGTVTNQGGSETVQVNSGGRAQFGGLAETQATVSVDSSSSLEIGTAGGAAAGALTVDPGITVTESGGGSFNAPSIVDNGVIDITGGTFALNGSLTGSGEVEIGSGGDAVVGSINAASANTVAFAGTGGIFTLDSGALSAPSTFTVSGFNPSDVIDVQGTVTGASYANGTLTITNGAATVAQLKLSGFPGGTFSATPLTNGYTQIALNSGGDTVTAPADTSLPDSFTWGLNVAGSWDNPENWIDGATSGTASVAPGGNDAVAINAAAGGATDVITGTGNSASLTIGGPTVLQGQFTAGSLTLENNASSSVDLPSGSSLTVSDALTLQNNAALAVSGGQLSVGGGITNGYGDNLNLSGGTALIAGGITNNSSGYLVGDSINISGGTATITGDITNNIGGYSTGSSFNVSGGTATIAGSIIDNNSSLNTGVGSFINVSGGTATITGGITSNNSGNEAFDAIDVSGALTVGGTVTNQGGSETVQVNSGGRAQFGGLAETQATVSVDSSSSLEIGTAGGAAAGALTVDPGITVTESGGGSFNAPSIVDNGVIDITGGTFALNGSLTGSGEVEIGSGGDAVVRKYQRCIGQHRRLCRHRRYFYAR